ncbi:MAG: radical SAM protein [Dehalococcoidia bacterium]
MLEILPQIPRYMAMRRGIGPKILPLNLVFAVTYRCNSRCKSCNIWMYTKKAHRPPAGQQWPYDASQLEARPELSLDEFKRVFDSLGQAPFYLTFTGGEPFLREDLEEIVIAAHERCKPKVITIPTSAMYWKTTPQRVHEIARACQGTDVILNISMDGIGEEHDRIRGVPRNDELALRTLEALKQNKPDNLVIGLHTVVSSLNVHRAGEIVDHLESLGPDSVITEVAEERLEMGNRNSGITPDPETYTKVAADLSRKVSRRKASGFARITRAFRTEYYHLAAQALRENKQALPCYAGVASGHVAPDGDVWACCVRAEPIGNVRAVDYDFGRVWRGYLADKMRASIAAGECACPMANAFYTTMLMDPKTLAKVALRAAAG